jgi:hypothetical protein
VWWARGATNDGEDESHDLELTGDESEPSLGATEVANHETAWRRPATWACSHPAGEDEPTMGATGTQDHLRGWKARTLPRLDECEDGHDAEMTNEDGGDINDEPHDPETDACTAGEDSGLSLPLADALRNRAAPEEAERMLRDRLRAKGVGSRLRDRDEVVIVHGGERYLLSPV